MENFFKWLSVPIPKDELETYFNMNNINREKVDLFFDILMSLNNTISKTYLGDTNDQIISVDYTDDDKEKHFNWCWVKTIDSFKKENIILSKNGDHYKYLKIFYFDIFYNKIDGVNQNAIKLFIEELFNIEGLYSKADLQILTEIYKLLDKNLVKK
jgi:hypothetical protein